MYTYTEKAKEEGLRAFPHLVYLAERRQTITYGELADRISVHHRAARHFLGYIRDEICIAKGAPLLTAIVVSRQTGLPGESFLPEGTDHLSAGEYRDAYERHRDAVFSYTGWGNLLEELHLKPILPEPQDLNDIGRHYSRILQMQSGDSEGDDHERLKHFISTNPNRFGILAQGTGSEEYMFISGDRCDVVFQQSHGRVVAEVKIGDHDGELVRGVYQAMKYHALMAAEQGQGSDYPVHAFLIAFRIPDNVEELASRFGITCRTIQRGAVLQDRD